MPDIQYSALFFIFAGDKKKWSDIFIELAYNGSRYHGWQIQPGASSVQEEINRALSTLLRQDIYVVGAGRTDTGVHASFFVAHFDIECELPEPQQVVL